MNYERRVVDTNEQTQELTPEVVRQKISDPYWLANYQEMARMVDSYTNKSGQFLSGKEEKGKWIEFLEKENSPIFEIWTKDYIDRFANYLSQEAELLGGTKENPTVILEVGAGSGKLSFFLSQKLRESNVATIKLITTDYHNEDFKIKSPYNNIVNLSEKDAIEKFKPSIVICSWMPLGEDWTTDFRKADSVQEYILIGPEGPCGTEATWEEFQSHDFEKVEQKYLSEVQISRLDIFHAPRKFSSGDFITKTTSFKRNNL